MRVTTTLIGIILLAGSACQKKVPAGFVEQRVTFKSYRYCPNLEGEIKLNVPIKFDTLLSWVDRSDAGGIVKLRFTNAKGCLIQESGYIYATICDGEFDRLTIETKRFWGDNVLPNDTTGFAEAAIKLEKYSRAKVNRFVWHSKSIETINKKQFAILDFWGSRLLGFDKKDNAVKEPFEQIIASTRLKQGGGDWLITLRFECKQHDCRDFAKNAYTILRSVEIDTVAGKQE